jgi:hypothetical protein
VNGSKGTNGTHFANGILEANCVVKPAHENSNTDKRMRLENPTTGEVLIRRFNAEGDTGKTEGRDEKGGALSRTTEPKEA